MSGRKPYLPTLIAVAVLIACAAGLLAVPRGAEAAFPGENGRIAFSARERTEGSQYQIFTVEADGTGTRQLTETPASEYNTEPVFSPDGTKIAWVRSDGIWIMDADGTGEERFADGENPAWSPDGKRLAFVRRDRKEGDPEIYKKALGAERARRVTDNRVGFEAGPAWSPDGSRIAFSHEDGSDIWTMNPDGTGLTNVTNTTWQISELAPHWGAEPPPAEGD